MSYKLGIIYAIYDGKMYIFNKTVMTITALISLHTVKTQPPIKPPNK